MTRFSKTDLFVIVTDWFDNPFEDFVYSDLSEAETLATEHRKTANNPHLVKVMNISDYAEYCDEKGSDRASYID